MSGAAQDVVECLRHLPQAACGASLGDAHAAAGAGPVGCFRASDRTAEIYKQASESSSVPHRQWSKGMISWAGEWVSTVG